MIWWVLRVIGIGSLGWFANNFLQDYQDSQYNKALAANAQVALEQAVIVHASRNDILSDRLQEREAELEWARSQKESDELIKQQLRSKNAELDKALQLIIDPRLAP